jgi:DNA-binding beta-propeller fold protein YncE
MPRSTVTVLFIAFLLTGCSWLKGPMSLLQKDAPELQGLTGWVNTKEPITLKGLRGQIVLLEFATYSCVNCIHILPFIQHMEEKYPGKVQVLTIHSGKYDNERDPEYVKTATFKYGIRHPVANDANGTVWQNYGAKQWPTLVLIDPQGKIVGQVAGDTKCSAVEKAIDLLVSETQKDGSIQTPAKKLETVCGNQSSEMLLFPGKVQIDATQKRMIISDSGHNRIIVSDMNGGVLNVVGSGCKGLKDGDFETAKFHCPQGCAVVGDLVYVADSGNHAIRCVDLKHRTVLTLATGVNGGVLVTQNPDTSFDCPMDVASSGDKLYVAMSGKHQIWELDLKTKKAAPAAGDGIEGISDGAADKANLAQPSALTLVGDKLYFADSESSAVRCLDLSTRKVSTLVGKGLFDFGDQDGTFTHTLLQHPLGLASANGALYVADSYNHKIKSLDVHSNKCSTLTGCGKPGLQDGDFPMLSEPSAISVFGSDLYIADSNNHAIRVFHMKDGTMSTIKLREMKKA